MASRSFATKYGKAVLFKNNPRKIREGQFSALSDSLEAHPEFMVAQKIVLWRVPQRIEAGEGEKCPFVGQEGELIVLSGNQRVKALRNQGAESIPDDWCCEAKGSDGEWWPWRDAEVFVNLANSPAGVSGDFDYSALQDKFDEFRMRMAGIDFSNFTKAIAEGVIGAEVNDDAQEALESDPLMGEKSQELNDFIEERQKTRKNLKYIDEMGFHLLVVFPMGFQQKAEFLSKADGFGGRPVEVNKDPWIDLVFESCDQKQEFINAAGLNVDDPDTGVPPVLYGLFCDGRALARRMGIELKASGLHFRDRIIDTQLAKMAVDAMNQKSEKEIEEEIYAKLKAERESLGMAVAEADESESDDERADA